jgi:hypothetical protein
MESLVEEKACFRQEVGELRPVKERLPRRVEELERRVQELLRALEESPRAGKRQAGPFSRRWPKAHPAKAGRKAGANYGCRCYRPLAAGIDETLPVMVLATRDEADPTSKLRYEKTLSNIQEVTARSGRVIAGATEGNATIGLLVEQVIDIPPAPELLSPLIEIVPLQLLAYYIAVRRGCDVDQPRNLAKSVTVE